MFVNYTELLMLDFGVVVRAVAVAKVIDAEKSLEELATAMLAAVVTAEVGDHEDGASAADFVAPGYKNCAPSA